MKIDPYAKIWQLSVGQQQRVEILKALYRGAKLFILDELTAVLTPQEVEELFNMIRTLTRQGNTVIFISHKLNGSCPSAAEFPCFALARSSLRLKPVKPARKSSQGRWWARK
jgi:ABC-type uncharacterized transport system ATPase subunit